MPHSWLSSCDKIKIPHLWLCRSWGNFISSRPLFQSRGIKIEPFVICEENYFCHSCGKNPSLFLYRPGIGHSLKESEKFSLSPGLAKIHSHIFEENSRLKPHKEKIKPWLMYAQNMRENLFRMF